MHYPALYEAADGPSGPGGAVDGADGLLPGPSGASDDDGRFGAAVWIVLLAGDDLGTGGCRARDPHGGLEADGDPVEAPLRRGWNRRVDDRPRSGRPKVLDETEIVLAPLEPPPEHLVGGRILYPGRWCA